MVKVKADKASPPAVESSSSSGSSSNLYLIVGSVVAVAAVGTALYMQNKKPQIEDKSTAALAEPPKTADGDKERRSSVVIIDDDTSVVVNATIVEDDDKAPRKVSAEPVSIGELQLVDNDTEVDVEVERAEDMPRHSSTDSWTPRAVEYGKEDELVKKAQQKHFENKEESKVEMDPNCIETANGFIIVPEHDDDANASADSGGFWSFLGGGKKEKKEEKKIHHKSYRPSLQNMEFKDVGEVVNRITDFSDYAVAVENRLVKDDKMFKGYQKGDFRMNFFNVALEESDLVYPFEFAKKVHKDPRPQSAWETLPENELVHMVVHKAVWRMLLNVQKIYPSILEPKENQDLSKGAESIRQDRFQKWHQAWQTVMDPKNADNAKARVALGLGPEHDMAVAFVTSMFPSVQARAAGELLGNGGNNQIPDNFPSVKINVTKCDAVLDENGEIPLPEGWVQATEKESGNPCFFNETTGAMEWTKEEILHRWHRTQEHTDDPNILTCQIASKDGPHTQYFIQCVNNVWMGEFKSDLPKCSESREPVSLQWGTIPFVGEQADGERPRRISLEESYTEEYAVNRHCGLCGIPVSNIVLSLMEKGAKVISYGRGGDFMSADGKKSYEMKPNFHATVVDYDFEEDEYIVKAGSHNIRVPQNKLLRVGEEREAGHQAKKEALLKKAKYHYTRSIHFIGGMHVVERKECDGKGGYKGDVDDKAAPFWYFLNKTTPNDIKGLCWECLNKPSQRSSIFG